MGGNSSEPLIIDGKRIDGRLLDQLREITIKVGILNNANGSAQIHWGGNNILTAVYGPRECFPKRAANPYHAVVRCRYIMAPFSSLEEHGRTRPNRRSIEISKVLKEAFENVILTEKYPNSVVEIFIEVLEGNGSTRCAGLTAASLALAAAGIPMKDIPFAISFGKIDGEIVLDLKKEEDNYGDADVAMAIKPLTNEIILLQMDGKLTREEILKGFEMAFDSAKIITKKQRDALMSLYENEEIED